MIFLQCWSGISPYRIVEEARQKPAILICLIQTFFFFCPHFHRCLPVSCVAATFIGHQSFKIFELPRGTLPLPHFRLPKRTSKIRDIQTIIFINNQMLGVTRKRNDIPDVLNPVTIEQPIENSPKPECGTVPNLLISKYHCIGQQDFISSFFFQAHQSLSLCEPPQFPLFPEPKYPLPPQFCCRHSAACKKP